jgi:hypothetical protein
MGFEEMDEIPMPFVGNVDLEAKVLAAFFVLFVIGMAIYHAADEVGELIANKAAAMAAPILGENPATGENAETGGAFD